MSTERGYTVTRPNGKVYRARKPPSVVEFSDSDYMTGIAVLRTHDVAEAVRLAGALLAEHELDVNDNRLDWWRLVPFDPHNAGYDRNWVTDTTRGVPCVVWMQP